LTPIGASEIRAVLAAVFLYYLCGYPLARFLSARAGGATACWMLPSSLFLLIQGLFLARLVGLSLPAGGWVAVGCVVAGNAAALAAGRLLPPAKSAKDPPPAVDAIAGSPRRSGPDWLDERVRPVEWLLAGAALIGLIFTGAPLAVSTDALAHVTAIRRSFEGGGILPTDIFYRGGDGTGWDPRMGLLHPLHALTCRLAGVDPLQLWRVLPAVFLPGVIFAISRFLRSWVSTGPAGDFALIVWILAGSGPGFEWLTRSAYPNFVAYPLALLAASLILDEATGAKRRRWRAVAIALLAFTGTLIHVVAGALTAFSAGLVLAAALFARNRGGGSLQRAFGTVVAVALGALPAVLFRLAIQGEAVSTLHTHPQGLLFLGHGLATASPYFILRQTGYTAIVAFLLLPAAAGAVRPERRLPLVLFTAVPWLLVLTPAYGLLFGHFSYLAFRLLEIVPGPAIIVLGFISVRRIIGTRRAAGSAIHLAGTALAAWLLVHSIAGFPAEIRRASVLARGISTPLRYAAALEAIPSIMPGTGEPPVVLSDPFTSYALGAWTGAHVVAALGQHAPPTDADWSERLADQQEMVFRTTDPARLDSLLLAYQVDYVLVNLALPTPSRNIISRVDAQSLAFAERRFSGDPVRFPPIYRDSLGLICEVRPGALSRPEKSSADDPATEHQPLPDCHDRGEAQPVPVAAPDPARLHLHGSIRFGGVEAIRIELPAGPVRPLEEILVPLQWCRVGEVEADLPLTAFLTVETDPPRPWFWCNALEKPSRNIVQLLEGRLYRNRVPRLPLMGSVSMARLPLGVPVPDTLSIKVPPAGRPGTWRLRLSLVEEPVVANQHLRDLFRDDENRLGPVVGYIVVEE